MDQMMEMPPVDLQKQRFSLAGSSVWTVIVVIASVAGTVAWAYGDVVNLIEAAARQDVVRDRDIERLQDAQGNVLMRVREAERRANAQAQQLVRIETLLEEVIKKLDRNG